MEFDKVRGTVDFYPEVWSKFRYIKDKAELVSKRYNFEEYEAPIIEDANIWLKKQGGELPEQMYAFKDKGGDTITLRPEMTPILARMVAKKFKELKKPIKWFSFPRFFRYERPQAGRRREFFQYNADILGAEPKAARVEILTLAVDILKSYGLQENDFYIYVNNREIIDSIFRLLEIDNKEKVLQVIDKKDKVSAKDLVLMLEDVGVNNPNKLIEILESSLDKLPKLDEAGERSKIFSLDILNSLKESGYSSYVKFDLSIVRGLSYYTDIVFEAFDSNKKFRAILGGGAYSNLCKMFSKDADIDGVGFGMGDAVLSLVLEDKKLMPVYAREVDYFIATIGDVSIEASKLATKLRDNYSVELNLQNKGLSKQFDYANYIGAKKIIIVGERDLRESLVTLKDMNTGNEEKQKIDKFY